jgi:hypothetical protein
MTAGACAPNVAHVAPVAPHAVQAPQAPQVAPVAQAKLDRAALRAKLAARRDHTMQNFLAYREARVYPINRLPGGGFRHVWIDGDGNLCAAATLVSKDWGRDAAVRAARANVEIRIADAKQGPLADWVLTSGFTHAELVAIQAPGFTGGMQMEQPIDERTIEVTRLYNLYIDVERQMHSLWDENLDLATDALMQHPDLARAMLRDQIAGPGEFARPPVG